MLSESETLSNKNTNMPMLSRQPGADPTVDSRGLIFPSLRVPLEVHPSCATGEHGPLELASPASLRSGKHSVSTQE